MITPSFWLGKNVFLTGHTGFKGGWLSLWLASMGARVTGYSLTPSSSPNFFEVAKVKSSIHRSLIDDVRNFDALHLAMAESKPDLVFHMAAQPLVRYSYVNPVETYSTNVMGTVNVLESIKRLGVKACVIVTSDKCYENKEHSRGYTENEPMGGYDPYSSSKACAELVTSAYRSSFFKGQHGPQVASVRAGNVIGGGDWAADRLVPDVIHSFETSSQITLRNPTSVRPWQHVLEPLSGYLILAEKLFEGHQDFASAWNFGPSDEGTRTVADVVDLLIKEWGADLVWQKEVADQPHEAKLLMLDCTKSSTLLNWRPKWRLEECIQKIVEWHKAYQYSNMNELSLSQIGQYIKTV